MDQTISETLKPHSTSFNCKHVFSAVCIDCKQDADYIWLTCSRYKTDCAGQSCIKCGEIIPTKKGE